MGNTKIEKCIGLRLETINDLARFASTLMTIGHGVYIAHFYRDGKHLYGIFTLYRDYFKYYGVPLFYYIELKEKLDGNYIL
ncbi:MAG TPA: cren protein, partial [Thermoprotei archaeon]|nr:cren protein [Thermoprotei archaeon]